MLSSEGHFPAEAVGDPSSDEWDCISLHEQGLMIKFVF